MSVPENIGRFWDVPFSKLIQSVMRSMFPAGAGMNRICLNYSNYVIYVPRRRGDEPEQLSSQKS